VLATEVNPLGKIHERGRELGNQILDALRSGDLDPTQKVHILAHSMGGLDARFCLSPANPDNIAAHVATLSTISTPHRGSPVADLLTVGGRLPESFGARLDPLLNLGLGIVDLTTAGAIRFNQRYPNHPDVRYFSYAGRGRDGEASTCRVLRPAHWLIGRTASTANDGLVSVESAAWGESPEAPWPADHADEIGYDLDRGAASAFDYRARYRSIVERLAALDADVPTREGETSGHAVRIDEAVDRGHRGCRDPEGVLHHSPGLPRSGYPGYTDAR
jgi:triacylglycerol lipase